MTRGGVRLLYKVTELAIAARGGGGSAAVFSKKKKMELENRFFFLYVNVSDCPIACWQSKMHNFTHLTFN